MKTDNILKWLYINRQGKGLLNGSKAYSFDLPKHWNLGELEYAIRQACIEYDVIAPEDDATFHKVCLEATRSYSKRIVEDQQNNFSGNNGADQEDLDYDETKTPQEEDTEQIITKLLIENSEKLKRSLIITDKSFYLESMRGSKNDDMEINHQVITLRPPVLIKVLRIMDRELLIVKYGDNEIIGNVTDIVKAIDRLGGVVSRHYKTSISAIVEQQRSLVRTEIAYPCVGVFADPENGGKLTLAAPQFNNVYATELKENGEANRIAKEISKRPRGNSGTLKTALSGYISLDRFCKPLEIVPVVGYAAAVPFTFELKALEKSDYFCQVLLHGPRETGKSTIANIATDDLYGVPPKGIDYIDSKFRMLQILNAIIGPQHIAEMETFDFDEFADTIKNGTDIQNVGSRGNADQTQNSYDGKSILYYSANTYKASKAALTTRMIMIPAQNDAEAIKQVKHIFSAFIRARTKAVPIGYQLLQFIMAEYPDIEALAIAINKIRSELTYNILRADLNIRLTDSRRTLTYALMLFGVRAWQKFILSIYPKLAEPEHSERWFNKYANIELFIEDIIGPLEGISTEIQQQNPTAAFIAWLESYISNQGEKEEGYTWMHARRGDYIYITAGVLQMFKRHCKQSGGAPFESLEQLATELTAHTGEDCKTYAQDIGRDEEQDPNTGRIIKAAVPYKSRKAVRVPMGLQGKLTAAVAQQQASK